MTGINNSPVSADHSTANLLEKQKRSVDRLSELSKANRDIILKFDHINDVIFNNGLRTRGDKMNTLYRLCSWGDGRLDILLGDDDFAGREECEKMYSWVKGKYSNAWTVRNYCRRIKKLSQCVCQDPDSGEWVQNYALIEEEGFPKSTRWLKVGLSMKEKRKTLENTLTSKDIDLIIQHLDVRSSSRSIALLMLGRDTDDDESGWTAKTGGRVVDLTISRIPVSKWLLELESISDMDDPYFLSHCWGGRAVVGSPLLSGIVGAMKPIKHAAKLANIDPKKRISATGLRSFSASHLYNQGVPHQHIRSHHGWSMDSKMLHNYVVPTHENVTNSILEANGMTPTKVATPKPKTVTCYNCRQETPSSSGASVCINCHHPLTPTDRTASPHEEIVRAVVEEMMSREDAKDNPIDLLLEASGIIQDLG